MTSSTSKIINIESYSPITHSNFKSKAWVKSVSCSNSEQCNLFKKGECLLAKNSRMFGRSCPYGKFLFNEGPTGKSKQYFNFFRKHEEPFKDLLNKLKPAPEILTQIGNYVYLPYQYINRLEIKEISDNGLIHISKFNASLCLNMITSNAISYSGSVISDWREKEMPLFIQHLSENFPELFKEIQMLNPLVQTSNKSNIGRTARLKTLNPCEIVDIHQRKWSWDGEWLVAIDMPSIFGPVKSFTELKLKPDDSAEIKITSENQVNDKTIFTT